jgi:3-oxoacyl-[acyl-carrier protein] reductase
MDRDDTLAGKVALITGGARGQGAAEGRLFTAAGATVVLADVADAEGKEMADEIGGRYLHLDVASEEEWDTVVADVMVTHGRLDVVVNNAAIRHEAPFEQTSYAAWRNALDVCLDGAFHCTQAAMPMLKQSDAGCVISIGGLTAHTGAGQRVQVVTAKAGLVGFTRALAHDLAEYGITVNCVSPGLIETQRGASNVQSPHHHAQRKNLLGRRGLPEEIAEAVRWLSSAGARYVTGQGMHVNGGAYLGG